MAMFHCAPDDGEGSRPPGCLCHTPAFARLNAHLARKFSRHSSQVSIGASLGTFAAGSGSTAATAAAVPVAPIVFSNLRLFDGKSDALIEGLRVVVEGKTIKSVEPTEAPLGPDARVVDCGGPPIRHSLSRCATTAQRVDSGDDVSLRGG